LSNNNTIYNNYFNNTGNAWDNGNNIWNITKTSGTSIIGGAYLGGNYWSDYYGNDTNGDGLGDTDLPYNSSGDIQNGGDWLPLVFDITPDDITVDIPLNTGWNLITVPVNISGFKASNLMENITGCQFINMFDSTVQSFWTYTGNPASDFQILDGHGYLIYTTAGSTLTLTGMPITTVSVPINAGWNVIGWFNASDITASSLHENITGCQFINKFDSVTQSFWTYTGNPSSDFVISRGMGLMFYTTTSSIWHGEG